MSFPKLVTDNTIRLLLEEGRRPLTQPMLPTENIVDYLKKKIIEDVERFTTSDIHERKVNALADLYEDIDECRRGMLLVDQDIDIKISERREKMGGFSCRNVLSGVTDGVWTSDDYEFALSEGARTGYCGVNLSRNDDGRVFKKLLPGKEEWDKMLNARLMAHLQDSFAEFIAALRRGDYDTQEPRK